MNSKIEFELDALIFARDVQKMSVTRKNCALDGAASLSSNALERSSVMIL